MNEPSAAVRPILRQGSRVAEVSVLHERLAQLGYPIDPSSQASGSDPSYGERTAKSVREFQAKRGLRADGICGPQTWAALEECAYRLGDRLLTCRVPLQRGDDVAELQQHLNALGFDAGRADGIFGPHTERALREFQDNAGIAADGVCGPGTLSALSRVNALAGGSVAELRERETLEHEPRRLTGRRIVLSADLAHDLVVALLARHLVRSGAHVEVAPFDDTEAARAANEFDADLFVAVRDRDASGQRVSYFGNERFRSVGGHSHAVYVQRALEPLVGPDSVGTRTYSVLRETRMAAIVVHLDADEDRRYDADSIAAAMSRGIRAGFLGEVVRPA